jgi:putative endonuclease
MKTEKTANQFQEWFVYIIECGDKSLYCGIATDVKARFAVHAAGKGAKYTRGRGPLVLVWQTTEALSHGDALRLERTIKRMTRAQKKKIIGSNQKEPSF